MQEEQISIVDIWLYNFIQRKVIQVLTMIKIMKITIDRNIIIAAYYTIKESYDAVKRKLRR